MLDNILEILGVAVSFPFLFFSQDQGTFDVDEINTDVETVCFIYLIYSCIGTCELVFKCLLEILPFPPLLNIRTPALLEEGHEPQSVF